MYPRWPGNASESLRISWKVTLGRGMSELLSWTCYLCDPTTDKWKKIEMEVFSGTASIHSVSLPTFPFYLDRLTKHATMHKFNLTTKRLKKINKKINVTFFNDTGNYSFSQKTIYDAHKREDHCYAFLFS